MKGANPALISLRSMGFEFNSNGEKFQPVAVVSNGGVGHAGCDAAVRSDETVKITAEFAENRALVERVHDEHRHLPHNNNTRKRRGQTFSAESRLGEATSSAMIRSQKARLSTSILDGVLNDLALSDRRFCSFQRRSFPAATRTQTVGFDSVYLRGEDPDDHTCKRNGCH